MQRPKIIHHKGIKLVCIVFCHLFDCKSTYNGPRFCMFQWGQNTWGVCVRVSLRKAEKKRRESKSTRSSKILFLEANRKHYNASISWYQRLMLYPPKISQTSAAPLWVFSVVIPFLEHTADIYIWRSILIPKNLWPNPPIYPTILIWIWYKECMWKACEQYFVISS